MNKMLNCTNPDAVYKALEIGTNDLISYLNNGGFATEGVFSAPTSELKLYAKFSDFGGSAEISKRLSPILEKGLAIFVSKKLKALGLRLRQENGVGYDYILETLDGDVIDYIETKITTSIQEKRIDKWTLNKNSLVKVPLHLLIAYKTDDDNISEIGVYLVDKDKSNAVNRYCGDGDNHAFASLRLMPEAINSDYFVNIIGGLSLQGKTSRLLNRPYALMERV
jgi:hypothetical protein